MPGARDGQLRIRRGLDSPPWALQMFDDELGLWLTLAQANVEEDLMLAGVPILRGPYIVDYTDIPHDGDTKTLWTPAVGDVLLALFPDHRSVTQWDSGRLFIGPAVDGSDVGHKNQIATAAHGNIGIGSGGCLDFGQSWLDPTMQDETGAPYGTTGYLFATTDAMQIQWRAQGGADPTRGHVELYALVARAVAP